MSSRPFNVEKYDMLYSKSTCYSVLELHGQGGFGQVAQCIDLKRARLVAIKIHSNKNESYAAEVEMLKRLRALDPEKHRIVRFIEDFTSNNLLCLAFEMLDKSLFDMMKERNFRPLELKEIRPMIYQLLIAFEALERIGIVHTDLKPDNVMLVSHDDNLVKLKLIDFGLALPVSKLKSVSVIQATAYRAPEVVLGLPLTAAVDMWGVGCIMLFLYFGINFFGGKCAYHRMKVIVHMLGQPDDHLLSAGKNTLLYFKRWEVHSSLRWKLRTPQEWTQITGEKTYARQKIFLMGRNLEDVVQRFPEKSDPHEFKDRMEFLSLLKSCLDLDAGKRSTASLALQHKFITMEHLLHENSSYTDLAHKFMKMIFWPPVEESYYSHTDTVERRHYPTPKPSDAISGTDILINEESNPDALKTGLKRAQCEDADPEINGEVVFYDDGTGVKVSDDEISSGEVVFCNDGTGVKVSDDEISSGEVVFYDDGIGVKVSDDEISSGEVVFYDDGTRVKVSDDEISSGEVVFYDDGTGVKVSDDEISSGEVVFYDDGTGVKVSDDEISSGEVVFYDDGTGVKVSDDEISSGEVVFYDDGIGVKVSDDEISSGEVVFYDDGIGVKVSDDEISSGEVVFYDDGIGVKVSDDEISSGEVVFYDDGIGVKVSDDEISSGEVVFHYEGTGVTRVPCDGASSTPSLSGGLIPAGLKRESCASVRDEDAFSKGSSVGDSDSEDFGEPSVVSDLRDGVRDAATQSTEEPFVPIYWDNTNSGCVSVVCNTYDDRATVGSTGGAAVSISSKDGAAAVIGPDSFNVVKKKKKPFRKICKFFSRIKRRLMSAFCFSVTEKNK